jgi:hypothetical protein
MTVTEDATEVQVNGTETEGTETEESKRNRDFTKVRQYHTDLAEYINANSGLDPISANQVKAMLVLRTDYGNTPEAKAARDARKAARDAEAKKYEGMTDEQKAAAKAANRAQLSATKLQEKANAALTRARELAAAASGSGEDLQAVVQAQQDDATPEEPKGRRGLGRLRG